MKYTRLCCVYCIVLVVYGDLFTHILPEFVTVAGVMISSNASEIILNNLGKIASYLTTKTNLETRVYFLACTV